ncbi:MAG: hypothetical protein V1905_01565 [bacterium]
MTKKRISIVAVFVVLTIIGVLIYLGRNRNSNQALFFYGDTCPHCKIVEEYMNNNQTEKAVPMRKFEVYKNPINAKILQDKAKQCGINEQEIGVPLLWKDGKCYIGEEEIINLFKSITNPNNL